MAASERPFMELAAWALQIVHQPLPWRSLPLVIALFATGAFLVFFGVGSLGMRKNAIIQVRSEMTLGKFCPGHIELVP